MKIVQHHQNKTHTHWQSCFLPALPAPSLRQLLVCLLSLWPACVVTGVLMSTVWKVELRATAGLEFLLGQTGSPVAQRWAQRQGGTQMPSLLHHPVCGREKLLALRVPYRGHVSIPHPIKTLFSEQLLETGLPLTL